MVNIFGLAFGPPSFNAVTRVSYGHSGFDITATRCAVLTDTPTQASMTCVTAPGTGAGLQWFVNIAGQVSGGWNATSYAPPSIAYFNGPGAADADTDGNQTVTITGNNFGAALEPSDLVFYTLTVPNVSAGSLPVTTIAANGTIVLYPQDCNITVPHTEIRESRRHSCFGLFFLCVCAPVLGGVWPSTCCLLSCFACVCVCVC